MMHTPLNSRPLNPLPERYSLQFQIASNVPANLVEAAQKGIRSAISLVPEHDSQFHFTRKRHDLKDSTTSRQVLGREALRGSQLNVLDVALTLGDLNENPGEKWDIFVCNQDLMVPGSGWVFGATIPAVPVSVQSVARFMNPRIDEESREIAVERLLAHEVGHMIGLVERDFDVVDSFGKHCTNVCVMRQALTPLRWIKLAQEEHESGVTFCSCCKDEVSKNWTAKYGR